MNAVDTNVLIYACDDSDPRRQRIALDLIEKTKGSPLLWQVACEFIAASRKLVTHGFGAEEAWARLSEYMEIYQLVLPSPTMLARARTLHVEYRWAYWDAMVVAAATEAGVTRIYSEDLPGHSPPPGLEIVNPFTP